jgi:uncharacterized protein
VSAVQRVALPVDDALVPTVTAALHLPPRRRGGGAGPLPVLLAPGAGGDLDGDGLLALATVLAELGHPVVRCNLPYREAGRRYAPRADRSVEPYRQIVAAAARQLRERRPWIVGGKSYGGRVASMAVAEGMPAAGLLFYGYPLHPPGKPERLRVDHWHRIGVPCLFLQGDRDPFSEPGQLEAHLRTLPRRATVLHVPGGDHSLRVTRAASPTGTASSPAATLVSLREAIGAWSTALQS